MPYIPKIERQKFEPGISSLVDLIGTPGEFNYVLSSLIHKWLLRKGMNYHDLNLVIGVLQSVTLEFYRKLFAPYEDKKIEENGDVFI